VTAGTIVPKWEHLMSEQASGQPKKGMDRRTLIKGAAVAGAAAWTAPMIIDSLSSPAAASSTCKIYWVKINGPNGQYAPGGGPGGTCFSSCPGGGYNVSDALWGGSCAHPVGCDAGDGNTHMPGYSDNGTTQVTVTAPATCYFSSETGFSVAGRYGQGEVTDTFLTVTGIANGATTANVTRSQRASELVSATIVPAPASATN